MTWDFFKGGDFRGNLAQATAMEPAVAHALATIIRTGTYWRNGWRQENADKCEWTFGVPLVTLSNGTKWKLQGLWSNCG